MKFLRLAFLCVLLNICLTQTAENTRTIIVQNLCSFPVYVGYRVESSFFGADSVLIREREYFNISNTLSSQGEVSLNYTIGQAANVYVSENQFQNGPCGPVPDNTSVLFSLDLMTAINGTYVGDFYYLESFPNTTIFAMVVPQAPCPAITCSSYPGYPCSDMLYVAQWPNIMGAPAASTNYTAVPTQCSSPTYTLVYCPQNSLPMPPEESNPLQVSTSFLS